MKVIIRLLIDLAFVITGLIGLLHGWHISDIYEEVAGGVMLIYGELRYISYLEREGL